MNLLSFVQSIVIETGMSGDSVEKFCDFTALLLLYNLGAQLKAFQDAEDLGVALKS